MALVPYTLKVLKPYLTPGRAAFLSCPDLLAEPAWLDSLFELHSKPLMRVDSPQILRWHKSNSLKVGIYDTASFFISIGIQPDVFDLMPSRGIERYVDLNSSTIYKAGYDLVFDNVAQGVCNIGNALNWIFDACKINGYIAHVNPCTMFNNGFYNITPQLYHSWYRQPYAEVVHHSIFAPVNKPKIVLKNFNPFKTIKNLPMGACHCVVVRKLAERPDGEWPIQEKFKRWPDSKK